MNMEHSRVRSCTRECWNIEYAFWLVCFLPSYKISIIHRRIKCTYKEKKTIPVQAWAGPEGSRRLKLPEFLDNRRTKVVRLSALRTHFCKRLSRLQGHSAAGKITSIKNFSDTIGNGTRDHSGWYHNASTNCATARTHCTPTCTKSNNENTNHKKKQYYLHNRVKMKTFYINNNNNNTIYTLQAWFVSGI